MRNLDLKGLAAVAALASLSLPAAAQLLVYEGFDYTDVAGDDPQVAARNNADLVNDGFSVDAWTSGTKNSIDVTGTSGQSFGSLAVSGLGGTSSGGLWGNRSRAIDLPLEDGSSNNLLADGATLWFSVLVRNTGGTDKLGFALSNGNYISSNQWGMEASVDGVGLYAANGGAVSPGLWSGGGLDTSLDSGSTISISSTTLIVGEIQWNANPASADTITLYTPDAALTQGAAVAVNSGVIANTTLDRVAVLFKEGAFIDEIRVGASYADVTPAGGGDTDPPLLSSTNPSNGQTEIQPLSFNLTATFSEDVAFGTGNITLRQAGGALVESFDVSIPDTGLSLSGGTVTINPSSDLVGTTGYYVEIDGTAIDDLAGNSFLGFSGDSTWSFTTFTPDIIDPMIDTLSPTNGETGVATNSDLAITFDENVKFGTGNITLRESGGGLVEQWDVSGPDPGLTLNPTGGTTVTINPSSDLGGNTTYYVEIDSTAIDDMAGNSFAGFSGDGTWSFTTENPPLTILADDFTGHSWSGNNVTVGGSAWDTENGLSASATIGFDKSEKATSVAGVINPDSNAVSGGGWDATITITTGAQAIELGQLSIGYHLLSGAGTPQPNANNKSGTTNILFDNGIGTAGSISGNYTAIPGDTDVTIDRSIDLSGTTLAANTTYVMTIDSFGSGDGHFKALDYLDLKGTLVASSNTYENWIAGFFPGETDPAIIDLDADPDGDGNDNGVENYFGTAPDTFTQGLTTGAVDTGANTFTFTHPLNATPADDLTATYRWSTDLQTFYDDGDSNGAGTTTVNFVQGAPSGGMVTVTATITGTEIPDKLFVDVEVAQNP